jgi:hypothetical protein
MQLHEAHGPRHGFGLGRQLVDREAADDFLGLGERAVDDRQLAAGLTNPAAARRWQEPAHLHEHPGLPGFLTQPANGLDQGLGRGALVFFREHTRHESHRVSPSLNDTSNGTRSDRQPSPRPSQSI